MKFLWLVMMFLSFPAFSNVVGTWIYSGSGCRDEALDYRTHRSKAPGNDNPVIEATFVFKSDGTASMEAIFEDGETGQEVGTYTFRGDQITIPEWQDAELRLIKDRIVITISDDESVCRSGEVFVYLLGPVD